MSKPQFVVALNFSCKDLLERSDAEMSTIKSEFVIEAGNIAKEFKDKHFFKVNESAPTQTEPAPPTSRHQVSVAANNRISDAVEYINKALKLNGDTKPKRQNDYLEEIKRILLNL